MAELLRVRYSTLVYQAAESSRQELTEETEAEVTRIGPKREGLDPQFHMREYSLLF
jgi:hypothetical protein